MHEPKAELYYWLTITFSQTLGTALGVAHYYSAHYPGLLDGFVIDASDATLAPDIAALGLEVAITPTVMRSRDDKRHLARFILERVRV